jgi:hypothetical protein
MSATDLKKAMNSVATDALAEQMSTCIGDKITELCTVTAKQMREDKKSAASKDCAMKTRAACDTEAEEAFIASGGNKKDFKEKKKEAAGKKLKDAMGTCIEEQFTAGFAEGSYACAATDLELLGNVKAKGKEQAMKCAKAAGKLCDAKAEEEFISAGGDLEEFKKAKDKAATKELGGNVEACVDGFTDKPDDATLTKLMDSDQCVFEKCGALTGKKSRTGQKDGSVEDLQRGGKKSLGFGRRRRRRGGREAPQSCQG